MIKPKNQQPFHFSFHWGHRVEGDTILTSGRTFFNPEDNLFRNLTQRFEIVDNENNAMITYAEWNSIQVSVKLLLKVGII